MSKFTQTTITVQGNDQEALEVYADESMEQTIAFCFDEEQANLIPASHDLYEACKDTLKCLKDIAIARDADGGEIYPDLMEMKLEAAIAKVK